MLNYLRKLIPNPLFKLLQPPYHFILSFLSAWYYGFPSRKIIVIGVTGTSGKTSTVYLLSRILSEQGLKAGYTSTAQFNNGEKEWLNDRKMTMPGRFFLQRTLREMIANGCKVAIVETTSQGIEQFRHRFINYDILLFTNLYPEHIEAHGSFANYRKAKGKLFSHLKRCSSKFLDSDNKVVLRPSALGKTELKKIKKAIVVNGDDKEASYFLSFAAEEKFAYSQEGVKLEGDNLEIFPYQIKNTGFGFSDFVFSDYNYHLSLFGSYNVINAVAALSVAKVMGLGEETSAQALGSIKSLAGKMETIDAGQNFSVLVDYAFEPKALQKVYDNLSMFKYQRLIHVLGSTGGGRDRSRRPILGQMAGKQANIVIVTNEDPYDEDPIQIIEEVAAGAKEVGKVKGDNLFEVLERREAMHLAFKLAQEGDLVLITGKGAEQYICGANGENKPWDDRRVAREELEKVKS